MQYNNLSAISEKKFFPVVIFFSYLLLALFLYRNTIGCRLVTDAQNWLLTYDASEWSQIQNSFGDNALHQGYHFFFFLSYKLLGTNETGWYILFTLLHALNSFLIYFVFNRYFKLINLKYGIIISISASLLFLVSPYQTEAVVWGATIHYLLVTAFILLIINASINYIIKPNPIIIIIIPLLYTVSLFTLELALCVPVLLVMLFLFKSTPSSFTSKKIFFKRIVFPLLIVTGIYFQLNKLILGSWVGHYGAETHLQFSIEQIVSNFNKYVYKFLLFGNFIKADVDNIILTILNNKIIIYSSLILYSGLFGLFLFYKRFKLSTKLIILFFLCFGAGLLVVINLFYNNVLLIEGDRLSYFASIFFFLFLSTASFILLQKKGIFVILIYLTFSIIFLQKNLGNWQNAAEVQSSLEKSYQSPINGRVFILNIPDNFNGAYLYRDDGSSSKFKNALELKSNLVIHHDIYEVLQFNMTEKNNGVNVEIIDSNSLKVTFNQWGNWWWRGGIGASDYENDLYKVDIDDFSHSYLITFKQKNAGDIFLYQNGEKWESVNGFK